MDNFVTKARADAALLKQSQELSTEYWQSFKRDSSTGRATTDAGPKVIIPAKVLAINLFNTLDETLGEVGSHLVLYGIGKTWGFLVLNILRNGQASTIQTLKCFNMGRCFFRCTLV